MGFIAAHTSTVKLHTLVTGVIYRESALLAKAISTPNLTRSLSEALGREIPEA